LKAVILAGGRGTRLSEETISRPKPMVEIGGRPILWHIMKIYSDHGVNDFIICCGYMGNLIKEYFQSYASVMSDVTVDLRNNTTTIHKKHAEPWNVTLVDTGDGSMTGGRLKRVSEFLKDEELFCFTYGDGVGDVDISRQIAEHRDAGKMATITAVQPPGRYGALEVDGNNVKGFIEKPKGDAGWINGGFFVLSPAVLNLISDDTTTWEAEPLCRLAEENQLNAYFHEGFWQPMDTLRDKNHLESLWNSGSAPWKTWT